jgi:ribose/xylose/arabinose/galactoside ABC-type transport system permease subunit
MTMSITPYATSTAAAAGTKTQRSPGRLVRRRLSSLSFKNIGAVYVWLLIIVIFSVWVPSTFPTRTTFNQLLNDNAVTGLMALAVVIPLAARVFDLSIAFTMSLSAVVVAHFIAVSGTGVVPAIMLGLGAALLVGVVNGVVVVVLRVDSFIATLATGSLIAAFITMVTNDVAITDVKLLDKPFSSISQTAVGGITLPVLYVVIVATAIWFVLEHTATGRRLYATGFNADSARLQGVRTDRLRFLSLLVSALLAGCAGVVFVSSVGSGAPDAGTPYLLSSYAAAFVGATQLRKGRFNAWGTVIAVLLLGTGTIGLSLASAPSWASNLFTGTVLILALVLTGGRVHLPSTLGRRSAAPAAIPNASQTPDGPSLSGELEQPSVTRRIP